jgi:diaminohydroxyphosphoribosylaminopyrimidine deaminase/5-amino-6-(5-phosphoribosylamino)uracil reductase
VWVVTRSANARRRAALERRGVVVVEVPGPGARVPVLGALRALRRRGLWSLMVEGGSEVLGSFLAARAFDHIALFRAPLLLGGRESLPAFGGPDPVRLSAAVRVEPAPNPSAGLYETWRPLRRGA